MSAEIVSFLKGLGEFELVVEATASYEWFVQLVEPLATRVVLAHPGKLRIIAESTRKSDKLDGRYWRDVGSGPGSGFISTDTTSACSSSIGTTASLLAKEDYQFRSNKIRRILSDYNLDRPDLFTIVGQAWLKTAAVSDIDRFCLDQLVDEWNSVIERKLEVDQKLREFAKSGSGQKRWIARSSERFPESA
ncbi:MAG: hypothetical protein U0941_10925 [Planctomycetaceae bacterium]